MCSFDVFWISTVAPLCSSMNVAFMVQVWILCFVIVYFCAFFPSFFSHYCWCMRTGKHYSAPCKGLLVLCMFSICSDSVDIFVFISYIALQPVSFRCSCGFVSCLGLFCTRKNICGSTRTIMLGPLRRLIFMPSMSSGCETYHVACGLRWIKPISNNWFERQWRTTCWPHCAFWVWREKHAIFMTLSLERKNSYCESLWEFGAKRITIVINLCLKISYGLLWKLRLDAIWTLLF